MMPPPDGGFFLAMQTDTMHNTKTTAYPMLALSAGLIFLGFAAIFVRWAGAPAGQCSSRLYSRCRC